jgi:hypothetical protein
MKTAIRHDGTEQELIEKPLDWQKRGLQYSATGYGAKIPTRYVTTNANGKTVRVYATCYSNAASHWFIENGEKVFIN